MSLQPESHAREMKKSGVHASFARVPDAHEPDPLARFRPFGIAS